ncbi:MAG: hypothetical protein WC812_02585 [Candidatus Pacearchaeota archaeon]|jgi:hypothetical protein
MEEISLKSFRELYEKFKNKEMSEGEFLARYEKTLEVKEQDAERINKKLREYKNQIIYFKDNTSRLRRMLETIENNFLSVFEEQRTFQMPVPKTDFEQQVEDYHRANEKSENK